MLYPSINLLRSKVDSSYTLVIMAAKRSRDLIDGKPQLTEVESSKPVTLATNEIAEDLISYTREEKAAEDEEAAEELVEETEEAVEEAAEEL
ncbi:MAG: DNA-directed RNA polymerase subunit omega [Firmicutes bacterium]|jgi:DNA-directed RNA polymerase subunit omega|nr:DNA-directed RNA polymerase subunit omega [Bacillota bacterium]MBQ2271762.1 DNA-directed RNA polymerase subunit omega [Bacillota bacterium]